MILLPWFHQFLFLMDKWPLCVAYSNLLNSIAMQRMELQPHTHSQNKINHKQENAKNQLPLLQHSAQKPLITYIL